MKSKRLCFILVMFMSMTCAVTYAQTCSRCKGHGVVAIDPLPVSHFGINKKIGDCEICGGAIFQGESHKHKVCPSCLGSGKKTKDSSRKSSNEEDYAEEYDATLTPEEFFLVEELAAILFRGKTETRTCETCKGTGRCQGPGLHHYGNMYDMLDINAPTPVYCVLCGGFGDCPNKNCLNGIETYTRPCTDSEKEEISEQIKSIYNNAYRREYGD